MSIEVLRRHLMRKPADDLVEPANDHFTTKNRTSSHSFASTSRLRSGRPSSISVRFTSTRRTCGSRSPRPTSCCGNPAALDDDESAALLAAADLVTPARTGVEFDYRGDVIDAHAPEMPTRFAKQLAQVVRGGVAVGMERDDAMRLAIRCARDSPPPSVACARRNPCATA